ncbi:MAG TPA: cell division protein ZapA [Acetobacteraceae bacterium]|nr:cell division protein ZapA [Acetobacteraceae bacterium]
MAQLTVKINGYAYTVTCEDGQETHLLAMAEEVDRRIADLKRNGPQSGEARLLALAALLLADELHDRIAEMQQAGGGQTAAYAKPLTSRLSRLAERAEAIADGMEHA